MHTGTYMDAPLFPASSDASSSGAASTQCTPDEETQLAPQVSTVSIV